MPVVTVDARDLPLLTSLAARLWPSGHPLRHRLAHATAARVPSLTLDLPDYEGVQLGVRLRASLRRLEGAASPEGAATRARLVRLVAVLMLTAPRNR